MILPVYPAFEDNNLAITLQTSEYFAPYASVTILSIIENTSPEYNYDILVMTWDMKQSTADKLISMADGRKNISIRVVDISAEINDYKKIAERGERFDRFSFVGVVRLLLPELLSNYGVVLNLDCDMLICADVAELLTCDMTDYYMGGVSEVLGYALFNHPTDRYLTKEHIFNTLGLDSVTEYVSGGLLLLNLASIRQDYSTQKIIRYSKYHGGFFKYFEQDAFNGLFRKKKLLLPMEWNWFVDATFQISAAAKLLSPTDPYMKKYYDAEQNVKNYHYSTWKKPWESTMIPYADKWWKTALLSPFRDCILERAMGIPQNQESESREKYLLFLCETPYQLLNAINIKYHYYPDTPGDLVLCSTTDLESYKKSIEDLNLFTRVVQSTYNGKTDFERVCGLSNSIKVLNPGSYEHALKVTKKYTDYFVAVSQYPYPQMVYYQLVDAGCSPVVHIYEEGSTTYTDDIYRKVNQFMKHELRPNQQRFINNIKSIFLYKPELYCGTGKMVKLSIPQVLDSDLEFKKTLKHIFGEFHLPKEKYLFFDENYAGDGVVSNHMKILDNIAEIVGKENIAVKMHPRTMHGEEIYRMHGYRIFSDTAIWEMASFEDTLKDKVLLAISSNTIWTPAIIADNKCAAISLLNASKLPKRAHARIPEYYRFIDKIKRVINKEQVRFYVPSNLLELEYIINYLEGETL